MKNVKMHEDEEVKEPQSENSEEDWVIQEELLEEVEIEGIAESNDSPEEGSELEDLDPEMPLWEDGPLVKEALAWKDEHGEIYLTSFNLDTHVMWRPMTRPEYREHVKNIERLAEAGVSQGDAQLRNEDSVATLCTLAQTEGAKNLAGIPSVIAQSVMEASGFVALEIRQL